MFYAVDRGLGNTICNDNELSETLMPQTEVDKESLISELAAVEGISANYPGGVAGGALVFGSPVVAPADSPYGTAIGGITLALGADDSIAFETAWEDHVSEVLSQGTIFDPSIVPVPGGFIYGGRGGRSAYFAKPAFQHAAVSGTQRAIPDFSWVADPYTGLITVTTTFSQEPPQSWVAFGGTGVATSMFSALWAIANQKAGVALGQAAPYLYSLPAAAVTDIVPYSSPNDVVATVPNEQLLLKPGMTATVRVITAERDNVLRVPDQALRYVPGGLSSAKAQADAQEPQVWVLRGSSLVRVPVKTGLDDDTYTEIVSGDALGG